MLLSVDKILQKAPAAVKTCLGISFDSADEITIFIGFNGQSGAVWDLPCIAKAMMPIELSADCKEEMDESGIELQRGAALKEKIGKIVVPKVNRQARGVQSTEIICNIEQQVRLIYGAGYEMFAPQRPWLKHAGVVGMKRAEGGGAACKPDTLVLVTDQDRPLALATGTLRWLGCRIVHLCDFNHRDDNDANVVPNSLKTTLNVLGKCATGPFGTGKWRKYVVESAHILSADVAALRM